MTKLFCALALLLALSSAGYSQIQNPVCPKPPSIDVTGIADVMVVPDEVVFSLDVTKRNKDMNLAKAETDRAVAKILEISQKFGATPANIRTDYISVEAKYHSVRDPQQRIYDEDGDEIGTRVFLGYDVSTTVIVKLTDLSKFERFFSEVMTTGLTEVNSVKFESSQMTEKRKEAREMAMKAAYEKALSMARAVNQTIGKAIAISEFTPANQTYSNITSNSIGGVSGVTSDPVAAFSPGAIRIGTQVNVTFLLN